MPNFAALMIELSDGDRLAVHRAAFVVVGVRAIWIAGAAVGVTIVRKRRAAQPLRVVSILSWIIHHCSPLASCGPSFRMKESPSLARNLTDASVPGALRMFNPLSPTPTTCTVFPIWKSPGGRVRVGGMVGSGNVAVSVG